MAIPAAPKATKRIVLLATLLPIFTVIVALLYAVAAYFTLFLPKLGESKAAVSDIAAIESRMSDDQAYETRLKTAFANFQSVHPDRRQRIAAMVPLEPDLPGIFVQLDEMVRKNGMAMSSIDAVVDEKSVTPQGRKTVRITMGISGGAYAQFKKFLADLEKSVRLFDAQAVIFTSKGGEYVVTMRSYFLDLSARPTVK